MAGGEGAKERRRLKRSKSQTIDSTDERQSNQGKTTSSFLKKSSTGVSGGDSRLARQPVKKTAVKKKVKKPKHLKRKLEQLSPDDEHTRKVVLKEIEEFQKSKIHLENKTDTKRQEPKTDVPLTSPKVAAIRRTTNTSIESMGGSSELSVVENDRPEDKKPNINEKNSFSKDVISDNNDSNGGQGEDVDEEKNTLSHRERGRRRRGRKDTAKEIKEKQEAMEERQKVKEKTPERENATRGEIPSTERYCVGRKPVTDFVVGQKYQGKVVYVKEFGVFFDIGCHSDAFCHVSRLHDDFVEKPHALFKEGDEVQARVVEIDRKQKRITISLQSDERVADEEVSALAREERKKSRNRSRRKNPKRHEPEDGSENKRRRTEDCTDKGMTIEKKTISISTG